MLPLIYEVIIDTWIYFWTLYCYIVCFCVYSCVITILFLKVFAHIPNKNFPPADLSLRLLMKATLFGPTLTSHLPVTLPLRPFSALYDLTFRYWVK